MFGVFSSQLDGFCSFFGLKLTKLSITNGIVSSNIYDKWDDYNFEIVLISHFLKEMFLPPLPMVYIFLSLFILQECVLMLTTSTTETYF